MISHPPLPRISFNKGSRAIMWSTNTRTYIQESPRIEQKVRCMNGPSDFSPRPRRLPCGGGGFGFAEVRDDPELLHKSQSIPVDPTFFHLAVREAGDAYSGDVDLLSRWRNPAEITFMGTSARPTSHDSFAFGNDVIDRQSNVGEGGAVESRSLLFTLGASPNIGRGSVMMSVGGGKQLVGPLQIALVPNFFEQTTDAILV